jgi:hypothetical protein
MYIDTTLMVGALLLASCSPAKPPCTEESLNALRALYAQAAKEAIESGACDSVQKVDQCESYRAVELHFKIAMKGLCE